MTTYEPHPDSPAPKDGDRARAGEIEGVWHPYTGKHAAVYEYAGWLALHNGHAAYVIKGVPVTVLRRKECDHRWYADGFRGDHFCDRCSTRADRLVPEREPVDLAEAVRVWDNAPFGDSLRVVLEWAGVPVKDAVVSADGSGGQLRDT